MPSCVTLSKSWRGEPEVGVPSQARKAKEGGWRSLLRIHSCC
jgi:hypothetical protein